MSNGNTSLYISIQSGSSERTLVSLTDKTRALDKETQLLAQTTEELAKASKPLREEQTRLQAQLKTSQKEVNSLQKAYDEYGDELPKVKLDSAIENHAKLKEKLSEVNAQLGANQKTYKGYLEELRKGELSNSKDAGLISQGRKVTASNIIAALGIGDKAAGLIQDIGSTFAVSAFGSETGGFAADILSSAVSGGAAMGSIFGPLGILAGAAAGGVLGLASSGTKIFEAQDDAFKEYYGGLYDEVKVRSGEMVEAGSPLASARETDKISFETLFGDENTAAGYLEELVDMANRTPFLYDDLVSMSKTLATYGYNGDQNSEDYILPLLQTIGDTGAALGMGVSDMTSVAQALGRMKSSDKTTLEYLNILNDRGIGAVGMLAEAKGVSQGDMYGMISKGEISGTEAVGIITAALEDAYANSMDKQSQTFSGISSTLEGLQQNLEALGGEKYNDLRIEGMNEEVAALNGELGDAIGEINRILGENQARKENLQEEYMREALEAVLLGREGSLFTEEQQETLNGLSEQFSYWSEQHEQGNEEAGAHMESLYEQAQALGQAYFDNSDFMKTLNDVEIDEIAAIRENTAGLAEATQASYRLSQELSKGRAAAGVSAWIDETGMVQNTAPAPSRYEDGQGIAGNAWIDERGVIRSHAYGLNRVPYDDYPALLHEGERVLTAAEARTQDAGGGGAITLTVTGNSFTGTSEEMADQLWEIIMRKLEQAYTAAAPK